MQLALNLYQSMALAVGIFYLGSLLKKHCYIFQKYCIPSPVIGGIIFALVNLCFHMSKLLSLMIDTSLQGVFMNMFFTSVGFTAGFGMLKKGGRSLVAFMVSMTLLIIVQNSVGILLCKIFNLNSLLGLALGSLPLTGGHGTSAAFGPLLESIGVTNATTVAVAAATYGLVAGNIIGNPLARKRILDLHLDSTVSSENNAGIRQVKPSTLSHILDPEKGTIALSLIFVALGAGTLISMMLQKAQITIASYVGAMIVGIIIRNILESKGYSLPIQEISVIGSISLNFFLALAMMGLKLHELASLAIPMIVILLVQTFLTGLFVYFITFRLCGGDYDAAVLVTGHCGFGLGATPNAMANMDSLTKTFGPSEKAYLIIPVCGGFFSDIINTLLVTLFINLL